MIRGILFFPAFLLMLCGILLNAAEVLYEAEILLNPATRTPVPYAKDLNKPVFIPKHYRAKKNEFRGVWISTQYNIDFPKHQTVQEFCQTVDRMFDKLKDAGFTAVLFQVRPDCDAFYQSDINPFSRFLTGIPGQGLPDNFDPLRYLTAAAHRRKLEFHAWLNPYRVDISKLTVPSEILNTLSPDSFAVQNPACLLFIPMDGRKYVMLNPGEPKVLMHIVSTVHEILEHYEIDAVHFDDYFYPYKEIGMADSYAYSKYGKGLTVENWRRQNVDRMIESVHNLILQMNRKKNKHVRFGISPFGIWANKHSVTASGWAPQKSHPFGSLTNGLQSYYIQYADSRKWIRNGWVDYVIPQLYWSFSKEKAPYAALADWWSDTVKDTGVDLYIGHCVYKVGIDPEWKNYREIPDQLRYNQLRPEIKGSAFFSASRIIHPENTAMKKTVQTVIQTYWGKQTP